MFWTSIHKLKTKLFFSSHHNHKKKKKKKKRKEGRKKRGCFFAAPIFWLWSQAWNNLSFDHLKKQIVLRLKKTKQKVNRKHSHPKKIFQDKNSNYQRTMWMPESW
jgi:hypothetical protein